MKLYNSGDKSRFYTSGFLAFGIYILVFVLFLAYVNESNPKRFDSFKKTTVLELDIILSDTKTPKEPKPKMKIEKKQIEKKIVKKSKSKSAERKSNLKSLFANVKTVEKKVVKEVVNKVEASSTSSRFKSKFEKIRKSDNDLNVSSALSDVKTAKRKPVLTTSAKYANDPYYSKIHELLAKRWNPMSIVDGLEAKILVIIYNDGEFDYKFLRYSNNDRFDTLLKEFLEDQKSLKYPPHNKGYKTDIEVTFKSKG